MHVIQSVLIKLPSSALNNGTLIVWFKMFDHLARSFQDERRDFRCRGIREQTPETELSTSPQASMSHFTGEAAAFLLLFFNQSNLSFRHCGGIYFRLCSRCSSPVPAAEFSLGSPRGTAYSTTELGPESYLAKCSDRIVQLVAFPYSLDQTVNQLFLLHKAKTRMKLVHELWISRQTSQAALRQGAPTRVLYTII